MTLYRYPRLLFHIVYLHSYLLFSFSFCEIVFTCGGRMGGGRAGCRIGAVWRSPSGDSAQHSPALLFMTEISAVAAYYRLDRLFAAWARIISCAQVQGGSIKLRVSKRPK